MKEPESNELSELKDKAMSGRLGPEELAGRPELEEVAALGRALRALPEPPKVSTNFTALVMQGIHAEEKSQGLAGTRPYKGWLRWPAWAAMAAGVALAFTVVQHRREDQIARTAQSVAETTQHLPAESVVAALQDFETIRSLPEAGPSVDLALLAALDTK